MKSSTDSVASVSGNTFIFNPVCRSLLFLSITMKWKKKKLFNEQKIPNTSSY